MYVRENEELASPVIDIDPAPLDVPDCIGPEPGTKIQSSKLSVGDPEILPSRVKVRTLSSIPEKTGANALPLPSPPLG